MTDIHTEILAATHDKAKFATIKDAVVGNSNIGIFGGVNPDTQLTHFHEWRLMGDCLEFCDYGSGNWYIVANHEEIFDLRFSMGVWGANRKFANYF